jgi:hypothetical protein
MVEELKLVIETDNLPAADLAQILGDLDKSFKAFLRLRVDRRLTARLALRAVRRGSIEVILDVIDAADKPYQARHYLAPFATHLAKLVEIGIGLQLYKLGNEVGRADRKVLKSLAKPVANGHASQINIVNNGSIVLNIEDMQAAGAILDQLTRLRSNGELHEVPSVSRPGFTEQQITELEEGKLTGTAFLVDEIWYARLAGGPGVLVPVTASKMIDSRLRHGEQYAFRGRPIRGTMGETIGIAIDDAQQI